MFLVVGLGNPGTKYLLNRHNIGFMALDRYLESAGGRSAWKEERKALVARAKIGPQPTGQTTGQTGQTTSRGEAKLGARPGAGATEEVIFAKPQTFMNLSGECVRALMDFYKIDLDHLLVVHDELDIDFGAIRVQRNRGAGGHNGLKSINEQLGTQDYSRLKLGIGKPPDKRWDIANWVLSNFFEDEAPHLGEFLDFAGDAIESFILNGFQKTATRFTRDGVMPAVQEQK